MPDIPDIPIDKKMSGLASRTAARRLPVIPDGGVSGVSGMSGASRGKEGDERC